MRLACGVGIVILATGCQSRLGYDKTITLKHGDIIRLTVDGPRHEQRAVVDFKSSSSPVDVYVCLKSQEDAVAAVAESGRPAAAALGQAHHLPSGSVEVTVPAGQPFVVILTGSTQETTVDVKITGK
jgi:hypothetical protein